MQCLIWIFTWVIHKNPSMVRNYTYHLLTLPGPTTNKTDNYQNWWHLIDAILISFKIIGYHTCLYKSSFYSPLYFTSLALTILTITLVQSFNSPRNINISNTLNINGHITNKPIPKCENDSIWTIHPWKQYYEKNYIILNYNNQFSELPPFSNLIL